MKMLTRDKALINQERKKHHQIVLQSAKQMQTWLKWEEFLGNLSYLELFVDFARFLVSTQSYFFTLLIKTDQII